LELLNEDWEKNYVGDKIMTKTKKYCYKGNEEVLKKSKTPATRS